MPANEFEAIKDAMGGVGWYVCKNGHPFTIGECTMPMEQIKCHVPGCGAMMGGSDHRAAEGVRRLNVGGIYDSEHRTIEVPANIGVGKDEDDEVGPVKGYASDMALSNYETDAITAGSRKSQVGGLSITILRCMCHMLMRLAMVVGG